MVNLKTCLVDSLCFYSYLSIVGLEYFLQHVAVCGLLALFVWFWSNLFEKHKFWNEIGRHKPIVQYSVINS